ncbi:MAG: membrane dipeptidase [Chloroflexi bacterium]|nr:membrane dipeptidase [Chloroflexota bacterium]
MQINEEQALHARRLHEEAIVVAAHTDLCPDVAMRQRRRESSVLANRYLPIIRQGGITAVCDRVAGDAPYHMDFPFRNTLAANRLKFALQSIEVMYREEESTPDLVVVAKTVDDIAAAKRSGKLAVVLGLEGASAMEDDLSLLDLYWRLGVRCIGLTHDFRNLLADGIRTGSGGGLTQLGREAVKEMNRLGLVVDVSHLNDPGFWDVVEVSSAPIHASHSNCRAVCGHPRNLTDDMLRAIAQTGGVVGVHALGPLITTSGRKPTFDELIAHIEHLVQVIGEDHVAIGPDLLERDVADLIQILWRDHPQLTNRNYVYPDELDSLAGFPNVTSALIARGFGDAAITKILGGNMLRLWRTVWAANPTDQRAARERMPA